MIAKDKDGMDVDVLAILHAEQWMGVLAAPHLYRALPRPVEPDVILELLDVWIARADRAVRGEEDEPTTEKLFGYRFDGAFARKLRALVAAWTPPDLPGEIVEAARALERSKGSDKPPRGATWDDFTFDLDGLIWSEGLDAILPGAREASEEEMAEQARLRQEATRRWLDAILPKP